MKSPPKLDLVKTGRKLKDWENCDRLYWCGNIVLEKFENLAEYVFEFLRTGPKKFANVDAAERNVTVKRDHGTGTTLKRVLLADLDRATALGGECPCLCHESSRH